MLNRSKNIQSDLSLSSYVKIMITALIFQALICSLQYILIKDLPDSNFDSAKNLLISSNYEKWLEITVYSTSSMLLEFILDWRKSTQTLEERHQWFSRFLLLFGFLAPNIALIFIVKSGRSINVIANVYFALSPFQLSLIIGGMLLPMFHQQKNESARSTLTVSVEKNTVSIAAMAVFVNLMTCCSYAIPRYAHIFVMASSIGSLINGIQLIFLFARLVYQLAPNAWDLEFRSHHHMSDFYYTIIITIYSVSAIGLKLYFEHLTEDVSNEFVNKVTDLLYLQFICTVMLTILPGRAHILQASLNEVKLQTRLNLIRYASHEMRTPLNTAIMGINIINVDLDHIDKVAQNIRKARRKCSNSRGNINNKNHVDDGLAMKRIKTAKNLVERDEDDALFVLPVVENIADSVTPIESMNRGLRRQSIHYESTTDHTAAAAANTTILSPSASSPNDNSVLPPHQHHPTTTTRPTRRSFIGNTPKSCYMMNDNNSDIAVTATKALPHNNNSPKNNSNTAAASTAMIESHNRYMDDNICSAATIQDIIKKLHPIDTKSSVSTEPLNNMSNSSTSCSPEETGLASSLSQSRISRKWNNYNDNIKAEKSFIDSNNNSNNNVVLYNNDDECGGGDIDVEELSSRVRDIRGTVEQVGEACHVVVCTLDDLLMFDKLDEKKLEVELECLNPHLFVLAAAKPFEINAREAGITLKTTCREDKITSAVGPSNLQQQLSRKFSVRNQSFARGVSEMNMTIMQQQQQQHVSNRPNTATAGNIGTAFDDDDRSHYSYRSINNNHHMHGTTATTTSWTDMFVLRADKFKLSQVFRNLISNALKFTPENGQVVVAVERILNYDRSGIECIDTSINAGDCCPYILRVTVKDTGHGISAEHQKKLFGQYVQFNPGALQKGGGSGLGLWISKSIVELHRGTIRAHSDGEGCGTSFILELPLYYSPIYLLHQQQLQQQQLALHQQVTISSNNSVASGKTGHSVHPAHQHHYHYNYSHHSGNVSARGLSGADSARASAAIGYINRSISTGIYIHNDGNSSRATNSPARDDWGAGGGSISARNSNSNSNNHSNNHSVHSNNHSSPEPPPHCNGGGVVVHDTNGIIHDPVSPRLPTGRFESYDNSSKNSNYITYNNAAVDISPVGSVNGSSNNNNSGSNGYYIAAASYGAYGESYGPVEQLYNDYSNISNNNLQHHHSRLDSFPPPITTGLSSYYVTNSSSDSHSNSNINEVQTLGLIRDRFNVLGSKRWHRKKSTESTDSQQQQQQRPPQPLKRTGTTTSAPKLFNQAVQLHDHNDTVVAADIAVPPSVPVSSNGSGSSSSGNSNRSVLGYGRGVISAYSSKTLLDEHHQLQQQQHLQHDSVMKRTITPPRHALQQQQQQQLPNQQTPAVVVLEQQHRHHRQQQVSNVDHQQQQQVSNVSNVEIFESLADGEEESIHNKLNNKNNRSVDKHISGCDDKEDEEENSDDYLDHTKMRHNNNNSNINSNNNSNISNTVRNSDATAIPAITPGENGNKSNPNYYNTETKNNHNNKHITAISYPSILVSVGTATTAFWNKLMSFGLNNNTTNTITSTMTAAGSSSSSNNSSASVMEAQRQYHSSLHPLLSSSSSARSSPPVTILTINNNNKVLPFSEPTDEEMGSSSSSSNNNNVRNSKSTGDISHNRLKSNSNNNTSNSGNTNVNRAVEDSTDIVKIADLLKAFSFVSNSSGSEKDRNDCDDNNKRRGGGGRVDNNITTMYNNNNSVLPTVALNNISSDTSAGNSRNDSESSDRGHQHYHNKITPLDLERIISSSVASAAASKTSSPIAVAGSNNMILPSRPPSLSVIPLMPNTASYRSACSPINNAARTINTGNSNNSNKESPNHNQRQIQATSNGYGLSASSDDVVTYSSSNIIITSSSNNNSTTSQRPSLPLFATNTPNDSSTNRYGHTTTTTGAAAADATSEYCGGGDVGTTSSTSSFALSYSVDSNEMSMKTNSSLQPFSGLNNNNKNNGHLSPTAPSITTTPPQNQLITQQQQQQQQYGAYIESPPNRSDNNSSSTLYQQQRNRDQRSSEDSTNSVTSASTAAAALVTVSTTSSTSTRQPQPHYHHHHNRDNSSGSNSSSYFGGTADPRLRSFSEESTTTTGGGGVSNNNSIVGGQLLNSSILLSPAAQRRITAPLFYHSGGSSSIIAPNSSSGTGTPTIGYSFSSPIAGQQQHYHSSSNSNSGSILASSHNHHTRIAAALSTAAFMAATSSSVTTTTAATTTWSGRSLRFLIVDDSNSNRKMARRLLCSHGHKVVDEAKDGADFLRVMKDDVLFTTQARFTEGRFDVILMDENMPEMSGPDATKAMRDLGYTGLIIGVTGDTYAKSIQHFIDSGANAVLTKPLQLDELKREIEIGLGQTTTTSGKDGISTTTTQLGRMTGVIIEDVAVV